MWFPQGLEQGVQHFRNNNKSFVNHNDISCKSKTIHDFNYLSYSYVLKSNFDSSYNFIINNKQNVFTCISPLIDNDISNNISIDLSGYVLKSNLIHRTI